MSEMTLDKAWRIFNSKPDWGGETTGERIERAEASAFLQGHAAAEEKCRLVVSALELGIRFYRKMELHEVPLWVVYGEKALTALYNTERSEKEGEGK